MSPSRCSVTHFHGYKNTNGQEKIVNLDISYFYTKQYTWIGTHCPSVLLLFTLANLIFFSSPSFLARLTELAHSP